MQSPKLRCLSLLLSVFLFLNIAAPSFARNGSSNASVPDSLEQILLPGRVTIVLDTYEVQSQGQIYSSPFTFTNNGTAPMEVTISFSCISAPDVVIQDIPACSFATEASYIPGQKPLHPSFQELLSPAPSKCAQIFLRNLETDDCLILSEKESAHTFLLLPDSEVSFQISGNLTPHHVWYPSDLTLEMHFHLQPILEPDPDFELDVNPESPSEQMRTVYHDTNL